LSRAGVDLNLLVALDALLTERNVTRAAEQISLGQPAMSAALARLRKWFNDPLLVRQGRGYVLTTLAESLQQPVRDAIGAAEAVLGVREAFDPTRNERAFNVLASDYVALVLLRPLLAELADEAPMVALTVSSVGGDNADRLRRGSADLLIYPEDLADDGYSDLSCQKLFDDRFVVVADRDNTAVDDDIDVERFSELPYIAAKAAVPSVIEKQLDAQGVQRRTEVTTETFVIVPLMVTGTRLVAIVQERLARSVSAAANLRMVRPPVNLAPLIEAMYWNPRNTDDPAHIWLRARLIDQAACV